jgi:hypothetical protein
VGFVPGEVVRLRPRADAARVPVLPIRRRRYFDDGGFTATDDKLIVCPRAGREQSVPRSTAAGVVVARTDLRPHRADWRVLVVDRTGQVLLQDSAIFYTDEDVSAFAASLGVPFRVEWFRWPTELSAAHPGAVHDSVLAITPSRRTSRLIGVLFVGVVVLLALAAIVNASRYP